MDERVKEKNARLANYETIKKYRIIKEPFSQEGGELTAALKLKRGVVVCKYEDLIEEMYREETPRKKTA